MTNTELLHARIDALRNLIGSDLVADIHVIVGLRLAYAPDNADRDHLAERLLRSMEAGDQQRREDKHP